MDAPAPCCVGPAPLALTDTASRPVLVVALAQAQQTGLPSNSLSVAGPYVTGAPRADGY